MSENRYLTSLHFLLAVECPTKLFYVGKPDYADLALNDAGAGGGFQVRELAKAKHPGGHDLQSLEDDAAVAETKRLLEQEEVIIYAAAVKYSNLFVRIDILNKQANLIDLIDVKARPFLSLSELVGKRSGKVAPSWKMDLMDLAFQEQVFRQAWPDAVVRPRMMLADKTVRTTVEGLNQKFKITEGGVRLNGDVSPEALGESVLTQVNVHKALKLIREDKYRIGHKAYDFGGYIDALSRAYETDKKIAPKIDCAICGKCTFQALENDGKKSGFKECWKQAMKFGDEDFARPSVMDLSGCSKKQAFLKSGKFFLRDLQPYDFDRTKPLQAHQWMQAEKMVNNDSEPWIDREGLAQVSAAWIYPLHFIEFGTSEVAIPFNKDHHPYETIAFQFSHHVVHADGREEHADEYLNTEVGVFPNLGFIRALKAALEQDEGTLFHYGPQVRSVLGALVEQLAETDEVEDGNELIDWIITITGGYRKVVDLQQLVKKYYYQRDMKGSTSIEKVLSAMFNSSTFLQKKYASIALDRGELTAGNIYARLQFTDLPAEERLALNQALLRSCKLDTLAMVMIYEAWTHVLH